jgi:hypothetical protein
VRAMRIALVLGSVLVLSACGGGSAPPPSTSTSSPATAASANPNAPKLLTKPESDKVTWKKDATGKKCHTGAKTGDTASVAAMSKLCVDSTMKKVGATITGQGGGDTIVKQIPLQAEANKCYRVFGIADATVTDFDIAVMDSAGKEIAEDVLDSNDAIVMEDGAFCFTTADTASVNVATATGQGKWAVEIWSN